MNTSVKINKKEITESVDLTFTLKTEDEKIVFLTLFNDLYTLADYISTNSLLRYSFFHPEKLKDTLEGLINYETWETLARLEIGNNK